MRLPYTTIRKIDTSVNKGMWAYKDKLTKIVIENKKSVKTAEDGGKVYGPFDESADGYGGVQSYVVCDNGETNCTGYLQGTKGIKGNEDSSHLFTFFRNVTKIEGLENIDTSNVSKMSEMFQGCNNLKTLDLSMWDTSSLTDVGYIVRGMGKLQEINLSNWDLSKIRYPLIFSNDPNLTTINFSNVILPANSQALLAGISNLENLILDNIDTSQVTNMSDLFASCSKIKTLDLSSFDTSNVSNMNGMFNGTTSLQSITFGPKFVHKQDATTSGMFNNCPSQDRPTGDTWNDVSFD